MRDHGLEIYSSMEVATQVGRVRVLRTGVGMSWFELYGVAG